MFLQIARALLILSLVSALSPGHPAQSQERLRIAVAGGLSIVPVWVMQEKGLLRKRGVNAELVQIASSPVAIQAMLSGEVESIITSAATLVTARLAGADVVMIMSTTPTFPSTLMAAKSIGEVSQLRARPVASTVTAATPISACVWCCAKSASIPTKSSSSFRSAARRRWSRPFRAV